MYPGNEKIKETKQSCCWSPVLALQTPPAYDVEQDICMLTPFDYKDQNPSGFGCLILIRAFVIFTPLGNTKFKSEKKIKLNSDSCNQMTPS